MPEQPTPAADQASALEANIHELARVVREARRLDPEARRALADLVDELSRTLQTAPHSAEETARVAQSAAHLAQALQAEREQTVLATARSRLEDAAARAAARAPGVSGLARRVLDVLADLGI